MEFIIIKLDILLRLFIGVFRKTLKLLVKVERRLIGDRCDMKLHRNRVIQSTQKYDMVTSPDEEYYQKQYWYWIKKALDSSKLLLNGKYLDLGCGQGRLTMPLAKWCCSNGGKVIGVDFSESAIKQARHHADEFSLSNIDYYTTDISSFVKSKEMNSFNGVLLLEVTFFLPEYKSVLEEIKRILKPDGLLFVSFRPQYFNALYLIKNNCWNDIDKFLKEHKGRLCGSDIRFTWQTSSEIAHLMEKELKFEILDLCAIGCCSGIGGDPHASIATPSYLDENEKETLMKLEIALANSIPDAGRYILCVARKR